MHAWRCVAGVVLASFISTSPALAQTAGRVPASGYAPGWYAPPGTVPVTFWSDVSPAGFTIERVADHLVMGPCWTRCSTLLYPGRYSIRVQPSARVASGKRALDVYRPMQVRIDPDAPWQRTLGLTMAVIRQSRLLHHAAPA